jgi:PglZ domain
VHPLHDYIAGQIAAQLRDRWVVVMYDHRQEFEPFFREMAPNAGVDPVDVEVGGRKAKLSRFSGSFLETKMAVEPLVGTDDPASVLVYVPGQQHDERTSLLLEMESAGAVYRPQLKQLARQVLRRTMTDVMIDGILRPESVGYDDLARVAAQPSGGEPASLLRSLFEGASDAVGIIASWCLDPSKDRALIDKGAVPELIHLLDVRLGLSMPEDAVPSRMRAATLRHVLGSEFLLDLRTGVPALPGVTTPKTKDQEQGVRQVAVQMRLRSPEAYEGIADTVEKELGVDRLDLDGDAFGAIDTFRVEEARVVAHCFGLVAAERYAEARAVIDERDASFWVERSAERRATWEVCRAMVELGTLAGEVRGQLAKANGKPARWVEMYVADQGWHRLDRAQRTLERVARHLDDEAGERALGVVRNAYEDTCARMAEGFVKALEGADWTVPGMLRHDKVFAEAVHPRAKPVAYLLVDALRYEMGVELAGRLATSVAELSIVPVVGALPGVTAVGMAALMPGAAGGFSVEERGGKLGALVDGTFVGDLKGRQAHARAHLPASVDMTLDAVLSSSAKTLAGRIEGAQVVIVRSQDIDQAGEGATSFARVVMDGVIENIARALKRLADAGVESAVVVADHGHLFFGQDRNEGMRLEAPGGVTIDLHRRCWAGRGGATPAGAVRVSADRFGYLSDLDFVFPRGTGVFKAGGDLAYHHGGLSLQELVVPLINLRLKPGRAAATERKAVSVTHEATLTNRIFMARIELGGTLFTEALNVRPAVVSADRQVATVMMTDPPRADDGTVKVQPGATVTVGFMLSDDAVKSVRFQVLDGDTDAVLYASKDVPVRLAL